MKTRADQGRARAALALAAALGTAAGGAELSSAGHARLREASVEILVNGRLHGTGWRAGDGRDVVTAAHVLWRTNTAVEVAFAGGARVAAEVVGSDPAHDLALLRLPDTAPPGRGLRLRERPLRPGERLWLLGAPMFRHRILLSGTLAGGEPAAEWNPVLHSPVRVLHISGPSPHGVSGGAWTDTDGRAAGVQSGIITVNGALVGIGYFAPADAVRELLRRREHIPRATLGCALEEIVEQPEAFIHSIPPGLTGLVPKLVRPESAAARAGLSESVLLLSIDGVAPATRTDALDVLLRHAPGDRVKLRFFDPAANVEREADVELDLLVFPGLPGGGGDQSPP